MVDADDEVMDPSPASRRGRMDLPALSFTSMGSETPNGDVVNVASPGFSLTRSALDNEDGTRSSHSSSGASQVRRTLDDIVKSIEDGGDVISAIREARRQLEMDQGDDTVNGQGSPRGEASESDCEDLGDSSDDDMTVECASPRDLRDVVDSESVVKQMTEHHYTRPPPVHPLPRLQASAEEELPGSSAMYSVKKIFPVVYEPKSVSEEVVRERNDRSQPNKPSAHCEVTKPHRGDARQPSQTMATKKTDRVPAAATEARVGAAQKKIDELKRQLQESSKSWSLQIQVAQSERQQLAQRNARLKSQLEVLTADLTRTKADAAKWKMENELYASKLPKLQAELSDETTLLDETHAQSIQAQLEITQLRAKVQVLQTRAGNLDAQVKKLEQELRLAKKDIRKRMVHQQQQDEKIKKLETDLHEEKANRMQELAQAKSKLTATVQRLEHERVRLQAKWKKSHQQSMEEAKASANVAIKKRKEVERNHANASQQLEFMKKRLDESEEERADLTKVVKHLEQSLRRGEQTETSLRAKLSMYAIQVQALEMEKKRLLKAASVAKPVTRLGRTRPNKSNSPNQVLDNYRRGDHEARASPAIDPVEQLLCSCCKALADAADRIDGIETFDSVQDDECHGHQPNESTSECTRCRTLEAEAIEAQEELQRVCKLHASELKIQAAAFERMLGGFRGAVAAS